MRKILPPIDPRDCLAQWWQTMLVRLSHGKMVCSICSIKYALLYGWRIGNIVIIVGVSLGGRHIAFQYVISSAENVNNKR